MTDVEKTPWIASLSTVLIEESALSLQPNFHLAMLYSFCPIYLDTISGLGRLVKLCQSLPKISDLIKIRQILTIYKVDGWFGLKVEIIWNCSDCVIRRLRNI